MYKNDHFSDFSISDALGGLNEYEKKYAPAKAYYMGDLDLLKQGGRVSVVGSRKPSLDGMRRASSVAKLLVENGITVVSGLAEGIDKVAHETSITSGGRTIAVTGTPLDNPYPKSNIQLFDKISSEHLVISQFPVGSPVQPKNFPIRNRTMALISHATIIVEAAEKSGTLHQGWEALRLGRPLFLMESITNDPNLTWPKEMLQYGAQILTRHNFEDLLYSIPVELDEETLFDILG
jgi:DNA processing protein